MPSRWSQPGGYREVLKIGLPLVVSMGSATVMQFTDRIFLSNYSLESIAAATPAGILSFLFACFFMGVATYVNVFVAQYTGAGRPERVAAAVWQGLYFCMAASVFLALLYFMAGPLFFLSGHPPEVVKLEIAYFQVLTVGSCFLIIHAALGTFFSGRGVTRIPALVNLAGAVFNIPLDYALINGAWGFPELGIAGAGIATVSAWALITLLYALCIVLPEENRHFNFLANWRFDRALFRRLMRFGLPGGVMFFVEILAITIFMFLIGRLGKVELAASNIVFALDTVVFLPMIGFHIAAEVMVGQAIGAGNPEHGVTSTHNTVRLTVAYMVVMASMFVIIPETLLDIFRPGSYSEADYLPVKETGVVLLRFVALYSLIDGLYLIYVGAIRGAGDTKFVMWVIFIASISVIMVPVYLMVEVLHWGLYPPWVCLTLYIGSMACIFWRRFQSGKWKNMRVIET